MMGIKRLAHKSQHSVMLDWQANMELGTLARFAGAVDAAAQQLDHQVVDDMGAEPAATLAPLGGDEGIEDARQYLRGDAATVVTVIDDQLVTLLLHPDGDLLGFVPIIKTMVDGVEDQVGIDLGKAAGEREDRQLGIALDIHFTLGFFQLVTEGNHYLMQVVSEAEVVACFR